MYVEHRRNAFVHSRPNAATKEKLPETVEESTTCCDIQEASCFAGKCRIYKADSQASNHSYESHVNVISNPNV
ncbi:uncharacterized protein FOMMEDRAFT_19558, partial [Fomitiporia mediterranea MF3/22]|uniref:uncharacterized protein n=1 Tax=Fomitiporia mediterranea (strain MF3/22) TaxID=694068 RepID=UPI0004408E50